MRGRQISHQSLLNAKAAKNQRLVKALLHGKIIRVELEGPLKPVIMSVRDN